MNPIKGGTEMTKQTVRHWQAERLEPWLGRTVMHVRGLDAEEQDLLGWYGDPGAAVLVVFDDGTYWIPMMDPEGNGAGFVETGGAE